eukprot:8110267-Alexandrium_andersonii.AAC.1
MGQECCPAVCATVARAEDVHGLRQRSLLQEAMEDQSVLRHPQLKQCNRARCHVYITSWAKVSLLGIVGCIPTLNTMRAHMGNANFRTPPVRDHRQGAFSAACAAPVRAEKDALRLAYLPD